MQGKPPQHSPALRFLSRGQQLLRLQDRVLKQVFAETESDHQALVNPDLKDPAAVAKYVSSIKPTLDRTYDRVDDIGLMLQVFFCRFVDNFQIFLEELLRSILLAKPEILKSGEQVTMVSVLEYDALEDFVADAIEEKMLKLGYQSIETLSESVDKMFHFKLFPVTKTADLVTLIFDERNLITHNYGIVNKRFLYRHPGSQFAEGQPLRLEPDWITESWGVLRDASTDIEKRAAGKFKIRFPAPPPADENQSYYPLGVRGPATGSTSE